MAAISGGETALYRGRRLLSELQDLHLKAGRPSSRAISRELGDVSHTTVADLLAGRRIASWEIVRRIVGHLGGDESAFLALWAHEFEDTGQEVQAGLKASARAPVPLALAQLPKLGAVFTGRSAELAQVSALLEPSGKPDPIVVSAVAGLAGVGKTELAVQAAHAVRQAGQFPGGVLFFDLHGYGDAPVEPSQALDALLRALGVAAEYIPPGVEERAGLYRSVLAQVSDPILIIADNASSEAQVRWLLPGPGPHRVLVTSRHTLAGLEARLVDITVLDTNAAVVLLDAALRSARPDDSRISGDPAAAEQLALACGGLPLALQITASILRADPSLTAADLAEDLAASSARLQRLAYDDGAGPAAMSVEATFGLSYARLDDSQAQLFRLLPANPGPDVSTAAAAALAGLPESQARVLLAGLARAHLVEAAPGAAPRWRMHDLLRLYADRLSAQHVDADSRDDALNRLLDYYVNAANAANDHIRALPGTLVSERFASQVEALAWLDSERPSLTAAVNLAASTGRDQVAMRLALNLAGYLDWRRRFDDELTVTTVGREAARRVGDRSGEATALISLGNALLNVRRFDDAVTFYQEAAAIYRETGDRYGEGMAMNNLGNALAEVRRFDEAITAHQGAAAIYRETGLRHGEGMAMNNLGNALAEVRRFDEAITAHQGAAAIYREYADRHGEGTALNNLGLALQRVRRYDEAITAHQSAAAIYREYADRHGEGTALNNLGLALQRVRRYDEAITAHQHAVAIYRETSDRHGEGTALNNLGNALTEVRRYDEAITAHQHAVAIYRETSDRHGEGTALNNLGNALTEVRRYDEAITAHQHAVAIYRETSDRHGEGTALNNLGLALQRVRRYDEAITAHQHAVAIYRETSDRHGEGAALNNLERVRATQLANRAESDVVTRSSLVAAATDEASLIVMALSAGVAASVQDAMSLAVTDAVTDLKDMVRRKLRGHCAGEGSLADHEQNRAGWEKELRAELVAASVATDKDLVATAQALLALLDTPEVRAGKYQVVVSGSKGVQVGDGNTQRNTFGVPPGR